jgi:hypothetical protein
MRRFFSLLYSKKLQVDVFIFTGHLQRLAVLMVLPRFAGHGVKTL